MRVILGVVLVLLVLGLIGWVTFDFDSGRSSLNFETEKARQDIDDLSESVNEMGDSINDVEDNDPEVEVNVEDTENMTP